MPKTRVLEPIRRAPRISSKHFARARKWFGAEGRIKVKGFERVPMELVGYEGGVASIGLAGKRISANVGVRGDPVFCFRESGGKGRVLLVLKDAPPLDKPTGQVRFHAFSLTRSGNSYRARSLIYSFFDFNLSQKIVSESELAWSQGSKAVRDRTGSETKLAPKWIAEKGFGRFMTSLALVEAARRGLRYDVASIRKNPFSEKLAVDGGFARASRDELKRYAKAKHPTLKGAEFERIVDKYFSSNNLYARRIPRLKTQKN